MGRELKILVSAVFINFIMELTAIIPPCYAIGGYLHTRDSGFDKLYIASRASGMGGAFVAVADDYGGGYFNPAGLVQIKQRQIGMMYSDLYRLGLLKHSFLCYAEPTKGRGAGEIMWDHLSADLETEKWDYDLFCYSYGRFLSGNETFSQGIFSAWGVNLKYLRQITDLEDATGYGLDVGFLRRKERLSWGVNLQNVFSQINWQTGKREFIPISVKIGTAYRLSPKLLLALDVDATSEDIPREICLGGEWYLSSQLALRLGMVKTFQKEADLRFSGGLGFYLPLQNVLAIKGVRFDYAFSYNEALDNTHQFCFVLDLS